MTTATPEVSDLRIFGAGGGGKGGGGGGGISEDPDTLSSVATARFIDLIGEGPIQGLVMHPAGEYSIYIDGVALKELSGTTNYAPFNWQFRHGTATQDPIPGFVGSQQEISVGVKVAKSVGLLARDVPDADADAVRVTVAVSSLTTTDDRGKISGGRVEYEIYLRVPSGPWHRVAHEAIQGKSRGRYQRSHELSLVGWPPGPYEVGVKRLTDDSTSALVVNDLYWDSYAVLNFEKFTYPYSAMVALSLDARYFSSIPSRSYHVRGLIVRVPANYDPVTRKYATTGPGTSNGAWDGTWKLAYTNNPAWCYYDLCTNRRYGLGKRIHGDGVYDANGNPVAPKISKWVLYQIAQYCDEMVPTGILDNTVEYVRNPGVTPGGTPITGVPTYSGPLEPRFTLNCVINTVDDAFRVLNNLASAFRGMSYWSSGMVMLTQDRPGSPEMIFNNSNVKDGLFNYEGSARGDRHTAVVVAWNDPAEDFKQKYEYVEDRQGIARYGFRQTEVVAFGCTSRSQARRQGLHILYTERLEKDIITFKTGLNCAGLLPGNVVQIMDNSRVGKQLGGRVKAGSSVNLIQLDRAVDLQPGDYTFSMMLADGTFASKMVTIASAGLRTSLTPNTPFSQPPAANAVWTLASDSVAPILGRVISIRQDGKAEYSIGVIEYNGSKYDAIDRGGAVVLGNYSYLSFDDIQDVTNLAAVENMHRPAESPIGRTDLVISWDASPNSLVRGYVVKVTYGNDSTTYPETRTPSLTIEGVQPGTYGITVSVVNSLGKEKAGGTFLEFQVIGVEVVSGNVTGLKASFTTAGIEVAWDNPENAYWSMTHVRVGDSSWSDSEPVFAAKATRFVWPFKGAGVYRLRARHEALGGVMSPSETLLDVTVLAPAAVVIGRVDVAVGGSATVHWAGSPRTSQPLSHFNVRIGSDTSTFGTAGLLGTANGNATSFSLTLTSSGAKKVYVQAVDAGGNVGPVAQFGFTAVIGSSSDTTPAPELAGFTVSGGFSGVVIGWQDPLYTEGDGHGSMNIYRALWPGGGTRPTFGQAAFLAKVGNGLEHHFDPVPPGTRAVYWLKSVTLGGWEQLQPTGGVLGVDVTTPRMGEAGAPTTTYIADGAITTLQVQDGSITNAKIGKVISSDDFNGVIDPVTGAITGNGTQGWAHGKGGKVVAHDIYARGDIEATRIKADAVNVVDTLNLAGNSVTVPATSTGTSSASVALTVPASASGQPVICWLSTVSNANGASGFSIYTIRRIVRLYRNGTLLRAYWDASAYDLPQHDMATSMVFLDNPGAGTHTYSVEVRNYNDSSPAGNSTTIVCMLAKR